MKNIILGLSILTLLGLGACASSYNAIRPELLNYQSNQSTQEVDFFYRYDVLNERGNKKYAKKESRSGVKVVAVKIVNNSKKAFTFGEDLKVHRNGTPVNLMTPDLVISSLKQGVPIYLLYLLLTPMRLITPQDDYPIGLLVGPGITVGNMAVASTANKRLEREMADNFLNGKVVQPGETVYGIIGIADQGYSPLELK